MKKLLIVLFLLIPFSAFASSYEEIQNIEIKIKSKTYNWISLYNILDEAINKKSKWNQELKLKYYEKLIKKTENKSNDTYKKINTILKYWKGKISVKEINSDYTYEEQLKMYPFYTRNLDDYYYKSSGEIKYQFESAYKRLSKGKNEYNNLVYDLLIDDYNFALSIYKDWWALNPLLKDSETRKRLDKSYWPWVFNKLSQKFLDSWYRNEDWILTYSSKLNIFKDEINAEYLWDFNKNTWKLVFEKVVSKYPNISWEEYKANLKNRNTWNSKDWVAYYSSEGVSLWHWNFSDEEIKAYWDYKFNKQSTYEKQKGFTPYFSRWHRNDYYNIETTLANLDFVYNRLKDWPTLTNNLIYDELVEDYNLYLSIYRDWGAVNPVFDWTNVEKYIRVKLMKNRTWINVDFMKNLWYRYENWKITYKKELNILRDKFSEFKYITQ